MLISKSAVHDQTCLVFWTPQAGSLDVKPNVQHGIILVLQKEEHQRGLPQQIAPVQSELVPVWVRGQLSLIRVRGEVPLEPMFAGSVQGVGSVVVRPVVDRDTVPDVKIGRASLPIGQTCVGMKKYVKFYTLQDLCKQKEQRSLQMSCKQNELIGLSKYPFFRHDRRELCEPTVRN